MKRSIMSRVLGQIDRWIVRRSIGRRYLQFQDAIAAKVKQDAAVLSARDVADEILISRSRWDDADEGPVVRLAIEIEYGVNLSDEAMGDWTVAMTAAHQRYKAACKDSILAFYAESIEGLQEPGAAADLLRAVQSLDAGISKQELSTFLEIRSASLLV